ncbi:MAG: ABC transporter permease subunit, partial [Isosphaeraceae bacterium]
GPAVLAGSLAGEKERGVLALLLTTTASSREIVVGRVLGKLTQVAMPLLAGVPVVVLLGSLAGMRWFPLLALILLPFCVAIGGGGLAAVASVVSRRGRDALLAVYLVDLVFLVSPLAAPLGVPSAALAWLFAINPFIGITPLSWYDDPTVTLLSSVYWGLMGFAGVGFASWRLRPSCLAVLGGATTGRRGVRRLFVPPVDEKRPMLWKELFIERVGSLGRIGTWIGRLLILAMTGSAVVLTGILIWNVQTGGDSNLASWARSTMGAWIGGSGGFVCTLIQWAIGLRAAVSISSERERGTWDALMTSPLEPKEIVRGKLWGSLYALRQLMIASLIAWTLAILSDTLDIGRVAWWFLDLLVIGCFMAAVGVRISLESPTATKAMSLTIGVWLLAYLCVSILAGLVIAVAALLLNLAWILFAQLGLAAPVTTFWAPVPMQIAWPVANDAIYALLTLVVVVDTRLRFDRLAGRMTGGAAAVAFDQFLYGHPEAPIPVPVESDEDRAAPAPQPVVD